jgi:hypothetical protein
MAFTLTRRRSVVSDIDRLSTGTLWVKPDHDADRSIDEIAYSGLAAGQ